MTHNHCHHWITIVWNKIQFQPCLSPPLPPSSIHPHTATLTIQRPNVLTFFFSRCVPVIRFFFSFSLSSSWQRMRRSLDTTYVFAFKIFSFQPSTLPLMIVTHDGRSECDRTITLIMSICHASEITPQSSSWILQKEMTCNIKLTGILIICSLLTDQWTAPLQLLLLSSLWLLLR